jgi:Fic family protein
VNDFHAEFAAHAQREREKATREIQSALFAPLEPLPPHNGTPTSIKAAERVWPHIRGMKRLILDKLAARPNGLTRSEIVAATGLKENSVNGRCTELVEMGMAYEDGERDGRKVLRIAPAARQEAA